MQVAILKASARLVPISWDIQFYTGVLTHCLIRPELRKTTIWIGRPKVIVNAIARPDVVRFADLFEFFLTGESVVKVSKVTLAILGVMLPYGAHAATDGTPGPTSTGTFSATVTASAPVDNLVEVAGLEDLIFAPVLISPTGNSGAQTASTNFCLARSNQGDVQVTVFQAGIADGSPMNLNTSTGGPSPEIRFIPLTAFNVVDGSGDPAASVTTSGQTFTTRPRSDACSVGQPVNIDHRISITIPTTVSAATAGSGGDFSGQFTLIVAPL